CRRDFPKRGHRLKEFLAANRLRERRSPQRSNSCGADWNKLLGLAISGVRQCCANYGALCLRERRSDGDLRITNAYGFSSPATHYVRVSVIRWTNGGPSRRQISFQAASMLTRKNVFGRSSGSCGAE